jgi:predicted ATP-grasp superfamily ATP-dependent carboligase
MFGNGTLMVSVHDDEVLRFGMKFFRGIGYCGLGSIEIKKDDRDGECKLIELNPRLGIQNIQATHAGLNFPLIEYADLTGSPIELIDDYKDGVKWLDMTHDVLAFIALSNSRRLSVDTWSRSISNVDCHAYFARDDLNPFLKQYAMRLVRMPRYFCQALFHERLIRLKELLISALDHSPVCLLALQVSTAGEYSGKGTPFPMNARE